MQSTSSDTYKTLTSEQFSDELVQRGASIISKVLEIQPEIITPYALDRFSKIVFRDTPTEAPYRINNVIWNLSKIWNKINYRCFLWALYANYGETIRSLHQESAISSEETLFYKSEFSNVLSLDDYDQELVDEETIDFPIMPQKPTDKEYNFLYQLYISNNYPLELYKYIRPQLSEDQVVTWRSLCQEKIIISKIIHKDFWVMGGQRLSTLQNEFLKTLSQRFLNLSAQPHYELSSYYEMSLKEHHALNKNFGKDLNTAPAEDNQSPFNKLSMDDKRTALQEACINHLNGVQPLTLEYQKYLAIYSIKSSHDDNDGRTIAIFRLLPYIFDEISEFNILFRNEIEQQLFKLYILNHYPSFFEVIADTTYFSLNWYLNLDIEYQIRVSKYYKDLIFKNLARVYRESPDLMPVLLKDMSEEERESEAENNLALALRYKWQLSREFLEDKAKLYPSTFFTARDSVNVELLWIAAKASPMNGFQFVGDLFSPEQIEELKAMRELV